MSEQKYYVAMRCDRSHRMSREIDGIGYFFHSTNDKVKSHTFTKSELAEIMDGAIYKPDGENCVREGGTDRYDDNEWINPLIKLVPVEEEK